MVTSNGEIERPRRSAGSATRAHTVFPRPRRPTTHASRPVPMIVRGRPHPAYCARAESSAQTEAGHRDETWNAERRSSRDKTQFPAPALLMASQAGRARTNADAKRRVLASVLRIPDAFHEDSCCVL
jgi:hypothetical protein